MPIELAAGSCLIDECLDRMSCFQHVHLFPACDSTAKVQLQLPRIIADRAPAGNYHAKSLALDLLRFFARLSTSLWLEGLLKIVSPAGYKVAASLPLSTPDDDTQLMQLSILHEVGSLTQDQHAPACQAAAKIGWKDVSAVTASP